MRNNVLRMTSILSSAIRLAFHQAGTKPTYNFHYLSPEIKRYCLKLGIPATENPIGGKLISPTGVIIGLSPEANRLPLIFTPYGSYLPIAGFSVPADSVAGIINKSLSLQAHLQPVRVKSPIILDGYRFFSCSDENNTQAVLETGPKPYPTETLSHLLSKFESEAMQNQVQQSLNSKATTHTFFGGTQLNPATGNRYRP